MVVKKQDGKEYSPIIERKDADALLEKAADGKLVLHAAIDDHSAKLFATPFAKVHRIGDRITLAKLVPITILTANKLKLFPDATIESYLAVDPTQYPDTHPFADHLYLLDVPQTVTREQIFYRCDDEDAFETEERPASTERTETQQRQVDLIEAVREKMDEQYDRGDKQIRMQALRDLKSSGDLRRYGYHKLERARKDTDPNQVKKLRLKPLPR